MARAFNGSSQYISAASTVGNVGNTARTIAFWYKPAVDNTRQFLWSEGDETGTYTRWALEMDGTSGKHFGMNFRSVAYYGTVTVAAGTEYWVAMTYDGAGAAKLYVNGSLDKSQAIAPIDTKTGNFNIGRYYGASLYTNGSIAEPAKWNINLAPGDITSLSKGIAARHVRPQSLIFHAPLRGTVLDRYGLALTDNSTTDAAHPRIYA